MAKKRKAGRPKMAETEKKAAFPLRLRPVLIKRLKKLAKDDGMKTGPYTETLLELYTGIIQ